MSRSRYIIGIDLGTTNSAVAYVDTKGRERPSADVKSFAIPQLVAAGETAPRLMLPSFYYLPGPHELPPGAGDTPWEEGSDRITGEFARVQGARVPAHLVTSAKSWLCHPGVDRQDAILPWGSPSDARKVSPVDASAAFLQHIRDAWDVTFALEDPEALFERQEVVLTVPASFDEAARELTIEAAKKAGYPPLVLLEEPQAAFYCWILTHQDGWQKEVRAGELILVCDVGGGTTDFSLITVVETPTGPGFRRVAVGDHLMLGGDNIDLALAHKVETKLGSVKLDNEQWSALRFSCRTAKEKLLGENPPERWAVTIPGRGSRVVGGSIQSELTRDEVREIVLDGFFKVVAGDEEVAKGGKAGLQEFGLPFVADPVIPRHLAAFLRRHKTDPIAPSAATPDGMPTRPDAILFNGGPFTPAVVRDRIVDVVASWFPGAARPRVLTTPSLDLAVSLGAAYYGVVRRGGGIRIGGGTARSFYVGFEGEAKDRPWLCVVPRDAQEGDHVSIESHDFDLLMGQPVSFPLASSSVRHSDKPGDLVPNDPDTILALPPLESTMRVGRKAKAERVPVRLAADVTEIGTIELWCESRSDDRRWRLQIQLRGAAEAANQRRIAITGSDADSVVIEQSELDAGFAAILEAFGTLDGEKPSRLVKQLETALDAPRDSWPPSALRAMWDPVKDATEARLKGPRHESRWFNLAGFLLRPGTGYPMDEARIKALWPVFHQGVKHVKDAQCWAEWWILWRRVSAGLNRSHHEEIERRIAPLILAAKGAAPSKKAARPKPEAHELAEIWRCAASLERLNPARKETYGDALVKELEKPALGGHVLWSLGRLGARVPLYAPANVVVGQGKAENWTAALLSRKYAEGRESADAVFALSQIARVSGDRARDLDPTLRESVLLRLAALGADESILKPVREFTELESAQEGRALGDSLPVGLRLVREG